MGRPVLRLATRVDRRTRLTAWAIALGCMVIVGTWSLVGGLTAGVDSVASRFAAGPTVYVQGTDLTTSAIDPDAVAALPGNVTALRVHVTSLEVNNVTLAVVVATLEYGTGGNWTTPFPAAANAVALDGGLLAEFAAASGRPVNGTANLTLFGVAHPDLPIAPPPAGVPSGLPNTWAWVRPDFLIAASPAEGGPVQAILVPAPLDPATVARLGLSPLDPAGAVGFARGSVSEAATALGVLDLVVAVVIALLVYSSISLEVGERRQEIRTLRGLGASPRTVAAVYEGQALLLAFLGAGVGSALGVVAAHAIVSFAPLFGLPNLVILPAPADAVLLAFGVAALASALAAALPANRAVRLLREAGPS